MCVCVCVFVCVFVRNLTAHERASVLQDVHCYSVPPYPHLHDQCPAERNSGFLVCLEIARHALYGLITVKIDYCDYCSFQPPKIREFEPIYVSYIQKGACVDSTTITVTVKYWLNTVCFRVNLGGER